jgi:hypothetical protein
MLNQSNSKTVLVSDSPAASSYKKPRTRLPDDFVPNKYTVLCGRGKDCFHFIGNRRFRVLVDLHLERYSLAQTKSDKSRIVCEIVQMVRATGGFCKQDEVDGRWYDVGDAVAREKVGALFRDCLHGMYKSSSKSKTAVRRHRRSVSKDDSVVSMSSSSDTGSATESMTDSSDSLSSLDLGQMSLMQTTVDVQEVEFNLLDQDFQVLQGMLGEDDDFDFDDDFIFAFTEV